MKINKLSKIWRLVFAIIILVYFLAVFVFVTSIIDIPRRYEESQKKQNDLIKVKMKSAVDQKDVAYFRELKSKYPIEFVIADKKTNEILYSTIPIKKDFDLKGSLNNQAIAFEKYYNYDNDNSSYNIWLLQYYISPQNIFDHWSLTLFSSIAFLVLLNFLVVVVIYSKFIRPLERLRDNVVKISKYQLDLMYSNNNTEYDQISKQLYYFAKDLEGYIDKSENVYTSLEKNLQIQNEKLENKNKMVATLTHDLKAPLTNLELKSEQFRKKYDKLPPDLIELLYYVDNISKDIKGEINDINRILYQDNYREQLVEIDLLKLFNEIIVVFKPQFDAKKFNLELDFDEEVTIISYKIPVKQIIFNALSNIGAYGKEQGNVILECYSDSENVYLSFYNDAKQLTQDQLDNVFKLFYRISDDTMGSGTGLYTIESHVKSINGQVEFSNKDDGVVLNIIITKQVKE